MDKNVLEDLIERTRYVGIVGRDGGWGVTNGLEIRALRMQGN